MEDEPAAPQVRRLLGRPFGKVALGSPRSLIILFAIGLLVRVASLPLLGTGDVDVWKAWSYGASQDVRTVYGVGGSPPIRGVIAWDHREITVDYPPIALYGLALIGRGYRALDPAFSDSPRLTIAIKLATLLADLITSLALWMLMRPLSAAAATLAALGYWLNPAVLLDGAVLGYLDPWCAAPTVLAFVAFDRKRPVLGAMALTIAVLTKPQAVFAVPFAMLLLLQRTGTRRLRTFVVAGAAAAFVIAAVLAPFVAIGAWPNVRQALASLARHDMLSAETANAWWIVTWLLRASYATHDLGAWAAWTMKVPILGISRVIALGYPNPKPIAALAAGSVIAWALWRSRAGSLAVVLAAAAVAVHAYACLWVGVHENHLFLALPLMAAASVTLPRMRAPFYLVSAVFAANLYLFQGFGRGFYRPWRGFTVIDATVVLAVINVAALVWHARRFADVAARRAERSAPASGERLKRA